MRPGRYDGRAKEMSNMTERISSAASAGFQPPRAGRQTGGASFAEVLRQQQRMEEPGGVAFSRHAMERAEQRGIQVDDALMSQLSDSVEKAQAKGATNILAFDATRAFIINVPNGRVITTMSQEEMKDNIFTNIDGAVIL